METIDVLVLLDVGGLQDENELQSFLKKKSFKTIEGEKFVYTSTSTTSLVFTRTYILEIFKEALEKAGFEEANLVFLLNEQPSNPYTYDKEEKAFIEVKEEVVNS